MTFPHLCLLGFGLTAMMGAANASAAPLLMGERPSKAWQCAEDQPAPGKARQVATLYFFDTPIEVERYSPETGLDRVGGISVVTAAVDGKGAVSEYTFGRFSQTYQTYEIVMQFSARIGLDGVGLMDFPQPAIVTIIDRISGEMRADGTEPGSSPLSCEAVTGRFEDLARAYERLMRTAMENHGKKPR